MKYESDTPKPEIEIPSIHGRSDVLLPIPETAKEGSNGDKVAAAFLDSFWELNGPDFDGGYGRFATGRLEEEVLVPTANKPLVIFRSLYMPALHPQGNASFSRRNIVARHEQSVLTPSQHGWREWEKLLCVQRDLVRVPHETDPVYVSESIAASFPGSSKFLRNLEDSQTMEEVWTRPEYLAAVHRAIEDVIELATE
jgi:hypothetical protein